MAVIEDIVLTNIVSAVLEQAVPHMSATILVSGLLVDALPDDCVVTQRRPNGKGAGLALESPLK